MGKRNILGYMCERCSHTWLPRKNSNEEPKVCPACHSPYWDRPRKNKPKRDKRAERK